jgi:metallo-beta-lactamase family protein
MAAEALNYYIARVSELDAEMRPARKTVSTFATARFQVIASTQQSKELTANRRRAIVISSSGMATGGRVLHHLFRALPDERNTVLLAGFQAEGTRGRKLQDGAKYVRMHGQDVPVRARIESLDSISAHADASEIMRWLGEFSRPPRLTCLVHGEPGAMDALKARIERELRWTVRTPEQGERIDI